MFALPLFPDAVARGLLSRWLQVDAHFEPMAPSAEGLVHDHIDVFRLRTTEDLAASHRAMLDLRRAMEGLNALACCHGLGIEENAAFWRRALLPFGIPHSRVSSANFRAFASDMLTRYQVLLSVTSSPEATAWAIATCFSMDPESEAMAVRRDVHKGLQDYFTRQPPMLQLDLYTIPFTADHHCSPEEYWRVIRRSFLHVHRLWKNPPRKEGIPTICDSTIDGGGLLEASELVALQRVEVTELVLTVVEEDPSTIANQLSTLMRELVRVDAVRKMMWRFKRCDRRCLEAIYSAIPAMKSLETFSVLCDDLETTDETTVQARTEDPHVRSYYAWLGYALAMRQVDGRSASVGVDLMSGNEDLFGRALQSPSALLDGISLEEGRTPVFLPFGSSAELRTRVILTSDITATEKLRDRTVSLVAEQGQRVDVIALCGSRAVIASPGCGLLCVDATDLHDWKTRSMPLLGVSRSSIVSEIMSSSSEAGTIVAYLELVGSDLRQLSTGSIRPNDSEAFQQILRKCPRLDTLIVSSLGVIEPLLAAYETGNCSNLSTLKIGSITNPALHLLLHSLGNPATSVARHVRRLSIELTGVSEDDARAIASVLTRNRRLTYLRLDGRLVRDGDESILDCLSDFVDQPVVQTRGSRRAAYVFLLAARRHRVLRSMPQPCAQVIAEFAATPSRRHVSWDVTS